MSCIFICDIRKNDLELKLELIEQPKLNFLQLELIVKVLNRQQMLGMQLVLRVHLRMRCCLFFLQLAQHEKEQI